MSDSDLVVLVPTRTRPQALGLLAQAFAQTCTARTTLVFCVDGCPQVEDYHRAYLAARVTYPDQLLMTGPRRRLVGTLNHYATQLATAQDPPYAIGFMGDDHRPRSPGWDTSYLYALRQRGTGIVYGNDELQGESLPTQLAMTTDIVRALGYLAPPALVHMYCDNYWKDLGERAACLTYLPEVLVTHHHPSAGRGVWDDSYAQSNAADQYLADKAAYETFLAEGMDTDVARVRALGETATP